MARLLVELRGTRRQHDITGLVGMNQVKISRLERGEGPPLAPDEAAAYAAALGATPEQRQRLVELSETATTLHAVPRAVVVRNAATIQARIRDYVAAAAVIRSWTSDHIPGVLQTEAWTLAMLAGYGDEEPPGEDWWAPRREHVALLDDPGRHWHILLSEGALRWTMGSRAVQAAQIRHIIDLSERPNVDIAVMDLSSPKPCLAAYGFHLYDSVAETASDLGPVFTTYPDDVAFLRFRFDLLWRHAVFGEDGADGRALLGRIGRTLGR